jgi:hypothetical protein
MVATGIPSPDTIKKMPANVAAEVIKPAPSAVNVNGTGAVLTPPTYLDNRSSAALWPTPA